MRERENERGKRERERVVITAPACSWIYEANVVSWLLGCSIEQIKTENNTAVKNLHSSVRNRSIIERKMLRSFPVYHTKVSEQLTVRP